MSITSLDSQTTVVNVHHLGGVNKLTPDVVYIGRPSIYGNSYSTHSGKLSREECVAFHRVDLYHQLHNDPLLFAKLKSELEGKKLGCWCKQPNCWKACHGDNFVHIFQGRLQERDYTKSVLFYLLDDLRRTLSTLKEWVIEAVQVDKFVDLYFGVYEAKTEIDFMFTILSAKKPHPEVVCEYLARVVIELEQVIHNQDVDMRSYWLRHLSWTINKLLLPSDCTNDEPVSPNSAVRRKKKV